MSIPGLRDLVVQRGIHNPGPPQDFSFEEKAQRSVDGCPRKPLPLASKTEPDRFGVEVPLRFQNRLEDLCPGSGRAKLLGRKELAPAQPGVGRARGL